VKEEKKEQEDDFEFIIFEDSTIPTTGPKPSTSPQSGFVMPSSDRGVGLYGLGIFLFSISPI
jgi:hypothetical protein